MANKVTATIRIELSPSAKTIRDAVRSFKKGGLINIDDKDLKEMLSNNSKKLISLTTPKRISSIEIDELVKVLDTESKKLILDIVGGSSLTLLEVNQIIDSISQKIPDVGRVFGAHVLPKIKGGRKIVCVTN